MASVVRRRACAGHGQFDGLQGGHAGADALEIAIHPDQRPIVQSAPDHRLDVVADHPGDDLGRLFGGLQMGGGDQRVAFRRRRGLGGEHRAERQQPAQALQPDPAAFRRAAQAEGHHQTGQAEEADRPQPRPQELRQGAVAELLDAVVHPGAVGLDDEKAGGSVGLPAVPLGLAGIADRQIEDVGPAVGVVPEPVGAALQLGAGMAQGGFRHRLHEPSPGGGDDASVRHRHPDPPRPGQIGGELVEDRLQPVEVVQRLAVAQRVLDVLHGLAADHREGGHQRARVVLAEGAEIDAQAEGQSHPDQKHGHQKGAEGAGAAGRSAG
ncbi:hypothetical protein [Azospirillum baldaniorum]|uniref:hypothetical protein n=1 Tax=Azospirillum baldaniorum TaxID=1064539 RepID=UPI0005A0DFEC|nr:hypothetical protein [Azospirillum baldaniorum]